MNDASSSDSRDAILVPYFEAAQEGEDLEVVRARLAAEHSSPELLAEFDELVAMLGQLGGAANPSAGTLPEGLPVLADFRIVREVGRGGMGVVYEAEQLSLGRRVALKINAGDLSPLDQLRFLREQHVLARLHQTHIVPIHTAGRVGRWQYFAMAYIDGAPLHHIVRSTLRRETSRKDGHTPTLMELASEIVHAAPPAPAGVSTCSEGDSRPMAAGPEDAVASDRTDGADVLAAPAGPLTLSLQYFRSVARVLAEVADALHYAHEVGVLHRDVKLSNLMVDTAGQCMIIDFGLAGISRDGKGKAVVPLPKTPGLEPLTGIGKAMGTPLYMAPEQYEGRADVRSDVWGLGCSLYELLTLRRSFDGSSWAEIREKVCRGEPKAVESRVRNVPKDLAAICRKALRKNPQERYAMAGEFATDLRRWLSDEPTVARPAWPLRRAWLWAKRNRWRASAVVLIAVASLLGISLTFQVQRTIAAEAREQLSQSKMETAQSKIETAEAREQAARSEVDASRAREQAVRAEADARRERYERQLLQKQRVRFGLPIEWSQERLEMVRDYYKNLPQEEKRRGNSEAASALVGLDAKPFKSLKPDVSALAFSRDGKRLVLGGLGPPLSFPPVSGGVWDRDTDRLTPSEQPPGHGPVAFSATGAPLQLVALDAYTLRLWDVDRQKEVRRFHLAEKPREKKPDVNNQPELALSGDGNLVAGSTRLPNGKGVLVVWEAATGKEVARAAERVGLIAFSPDNALLATVGETGEDASAIAVRPLKQLDHSTILPRSRMPVRCLAFTRDPLRRHPGGREASGWLLAAGESGGGITIWDVERRKPRTYCLGSHYDVNDVAFSPDGTLLASVGRNAPRVWDVATGQLLLTLKERASIFTGAAFSPDGRALAVGAVSIFGPGGAEVYDLEHGRGIQPLRGLRSQVAYVSLSPDRRFLAALSHAWQLGVWDYRTGQLLHIFEAPRGLTADNAAIAFNLDGRRLACSAGQGAVLWDVASGREIRRWPLPEGLSDRLAFHPSGKLLLSRVECEDIQHAPNNFAHPATYPRVIRIRDLLSQNPDEKLRILRELNWHVSYAGCTPDGKYFIARGRRERGGKLESKLIVYDGLSGAILWELRRDKESEMPQARLDPTGRVLVLTPPEQERKDLVELQTGRSLGSIPKGWPLDPDAEWWVWGAAGDLSVLTSGYQLHRRGESESLVTLGSDSISSSVDLLFDAAGTRLIWGNADGTVTINDIPEIRRRLTAIGLGW